MPSPAALLVREVLDEYGTVARSHLRRYLAGREPARHLYALAADYPERGGRSMRASLCLASARAFGADPADALNSAAAVEMLHNAFLIHDDVEDDSEERRGRPTMHLIHGVPIAINVGDALAVLSLRPLIDNVSILGSRLALRVLEEAERMARESVEGQAMELWWREHNVVDLGERDYLELILKKTCWYSTIYPMRIGALIGTRDGVDLDRYLRFGFFVGAAFQIQDDLLNLIGDAAKYGKELDGDIWEGKRTLMLIHALSEASPEDRARITALLGLTRGERTHADVQWVRALMDRHGSIDYARKVAHGLAGAALHEFEVAYGDLPESRDKRFLEAVATWAIERA
ncbi:Octaprenyl diphosphate synthase [Minicystis rosea]|nr:Octaprenyl diphosphate synthase [Minicystis rosea]